MDIIPLVVPLGGKSKMPLRMLPAIIKPAEWFVAARWHYVGDIKTMVQCNKRHVAEWPAKKYPLWEGECLVCDCAKKLWRTGRRREYDQLKARERYYYRVVRRIPQNANVTYTAAQGFDTPRILGVPISVHEKIFLAVMGNETFRPIFGNIMDCNTGRDISLIIEMKDIPGGRSFPDYDVKFEAPSVATDECNWVHWMQHLPDLNEVFKPYDEESVVKLLWDHYTLAIRRFRKRYRSLDAPWEQSCNMV